MRFFIGCTEICGLINIYGNELRSRGHQVTTCINSKHRFFADQDYDLISNYWGDYLLGNNTNKPFGKPYGFFNKVALKLRTVTPIFDSYIAKSIYENHDVFIFLWAGDYLMRNGKDLEVLRKMGKKVISIFVGSDIRYAQGFQQEFGENIEEWPDHYRKSYSHYNQILRMAELHSDFLFSVPDQSGIGIRPYYHFPIPLDLPNYKFRWTDRDVPVVVHAPSAPALKGTDVILNTLQQLKDEGLEFETKYIQNMKNTELRDLLTNSDILVDELILNGPGILSMEAMASGCAVATHYYKESPECFRPPVCNIDHPNLYSVLKKLIQDKGFRHQLALQGRKYIEENNDVKIVVDNILDLLNNANRNPDYEPHFFRDQFVLPTSEEITAKDKALTKEVAEKWLPDFPKYKTSLTNRGLI